VVLIKQHVSAYSEAIIRLMISCVLTFIVLYFINKSKHNQNMYSLLEGVAF